MSVDTQAEALISHAAEPLLSPPRHGWAPGGENARLAVMTGFAVGAGWAVTKLLASAPSNRERGLARGMSTLLVLDAVTGFPLAVMGSTYLTAARTAATAVLAVRTLAPRRVRDVGLYGTGPIAELIVRTLAAIDRTWSVVAYSPTPERRAAFGARVSDLPIEVRVTDQRHAPAGCAVVVAATDGSGHAFDAAWLAPGATVVSVASRAAVAEVPAAAFPQARVVVDDVQGARGEAAEFAGGVAIYGPLGAVLSGALPGRAGDDERWIFKATGLGIQDALTARDVLRSAWARGVGQRVRLVASAAEPWVVAPSEASAPREGSDRART